MLWIDKRLPADTIDMYLLRAFVASCRIAFGSRVAVTHSPTLPVAEWRLSSPTTSPAYLENFEVCLPAVGDGSHFRLSRDAPVSSEK